jgi:glucose-1-phosphate cytidylyltransferase
MKVIILAGGLGTRLSEETSDKPKPMVEIGGKPILWHIMKTYQSQLKCEFIIATGHLSLVIENYLLSEEFLDEGIKANALFTGDSTSTGGRIRQALNNCLSETVMVTYGDGVSDINLPALLDFHFEHKKLATVTAVRPAARFGRLEIVGSKVTSFAEKSQAEEGWINGGYFVFEPGVRDYLVNDEQPLEHEPLSRLAKDENLMAYKHFGFWQPMDTLREKLDLEKLISKSEAPWMQKFQ